MSMNILAYQKGIKTIPKVTQVVNLDGCHHQAGQMDERYTDFRITAMLKREDFKAIINCQGTSIVWRNPKYHLAAWETAHLAK